jgi:hypothetical protein
MKEAAFRTLMATRAFPNRTSAEHVQALNGIEIKFANGSNKTRPWLRLGTPGALHNILHSIQIETIIPREVPGTPPFGKTGERVGWVARIP